MTEMRQLIIKIDRVLDSLYRWVCRTIFLKMRACLTGVGAIVSLVLIGWILAPTTEPIPMSTLIGLAIVGAIMGLVVHKYYTRVKALDKAMTWLERKATRKTAPITEENS